MKTLILCRHAKSDWPAGVNDLDRPLKARGEADADFLGEVLAGQEFLPDLILSSPAKRAQQTAQRVAAKLGYEEQAIRTERSVYYEGVSSLIGLVRGLPDEVDTVMIFGHNPTMEATVGKLLGIQADFVMPTCAMACLESQSFNWKRWATPELHLRWFLVPRLRRK
jgi:phosphohistidine phosphatase